MRALTFVTDYNSTGFRQIADRQGVRAQSGDLEAVQKRLAGYLFDTIAGRIERFEKWKMLPQKI